MVHGEQFYYKEDFRVGKKVQKFEIKNEEDKFSLVKIETKVPKWVFNELVDVVYQQGSNMKELVRDLCVQKAKEKSDNSSR